MSSSYTGLGDAKTSEIKKTCLVKGKLYLKIIKTLPHAALVCGVKLSNISLYAIYALGKTKCHVLFGIRLLKRGLNA